MKRTFIVGAHPAARGNALEAVRTALDGVLQTILPTMSRETAEKLMDMIVEGWA